MSGKERTCGTERWYNNLLVTLNARFNVSLPVLVGGFALQSRILGNVLDLDLDASSEHYIGR